MALKSEPVSEPSTQGSKTQIAKRYFNFRFLILEWGLTANVPGLLFDKVLACLQKRV